MFHNDAIEEGRRPGRKEKIASGAKKFVLQPLEPENDGQSGGKLLAVTAILDAPGSRRWRVCGKLFGASFLRHLWGGRVVIARNFEEPLFPVERAGLMDGELEPRSKKTPPEFPSMTHSTTG